MPERTQDYTVPELAAEKGMSRAHVYNLIARGELGCVKWGKLIRIQPAHVAEYEARHQCPASVSTPMDTGTSPTRKGAAVVPFRHGAAIVSEPSRSMRTGKQTVPNPNRNGR